VLVHVHCASRASFWRKAVFMAIAHAARCPVILHLHGGGFARFYEEECGLLQRWLVRRVLARAACVVAVSGRWRNWLAQLQANPNLVCLPNPVALPPAAPPRGPRNVVLFLGRIEAAKGIPELLDAFAGLRPGVPDALLVCAGAGDIEAAARQARRLGLGDSVRFPGWIDGEEKRAWLARAALFVLPSHAEGLPVSLLEALAAGLPVVASAVGGIPDVVHDGVNGFLVAPGDRVALLRAMGRVLNDAQLGAALGAAGRAAMRARFAPGRVLADLERLYAGFVLAGAENAAPRLRRAA
jgi:glycosyltransferase involved in cell wall biosynthesis